jgi:hypothetical protein
MCFVAAWAASGLARQTRVPVTAAAANLDNLGTTLLP